jgi:hypothetical protein
MRKLLLLGLAVVFFATPAFADVWVKGHYRADGTWVPGHWKTARIRTTIRTPGRWVAGRSSSSR